MNNSDNTPASQDALMRPGYKAKKRGVALILVVSFIVLISALVVGFFSRVTTDLASSRSYAEGVNVRQLADSAVGIVMGQIREATTIKDGCWASQPGMIRVYRNSDRPGPEPYRFYKLYSSDDLVLSTQEEFRKFDPTIVDVSGSGSGMEIPFGTGGWKAQPALFTDLNEPVNVPNPQSKDPNSTISRYPIFDPDVALIYDSARSRPKNPNWKSKVEGCEIMLPQSERKDNAAPMPVRWVYVLKDGTMTAPPALTSGSGEAGLKATWQTTGSDGTKTGVPTKDNPIVGRIAYWTDDETCKVNINTAGGFVTPEEMRAETDVNYRTPTGKASGKETNPGYYAGSFWDTPRTQTYFEAGINDADPTKFRGGLANSQPGQNEFQRYPGHPSTTSLGLALQNLFPGGTTGLNSEKLYALTPRLMPGGSENGTVRLEIKLDKPLDIKSGYESAQKRGSSESYHLYASVDEFFYSSKNGQLKGDGTRKTAVEGVNDWAQSASESNLSSNSITPTLVDRARFFLTASSRAPELNLFGRPRVSMWPVPSAYRERELQSNNLRNAKDDLIRYCATIGRSSGRGATARQGEFIFERQEPYSTTYDFQTLPRNKEVFAYLQEMTSSNTGIVPGFGGSFETKYAGGPGGRDQILMEIFDYIRTINQKDGSREKLIDDKFAPVTTSTNSTADTNSRLKTAARYAPHGLVIPTRVNIGGKQLSGFGRYPTITEAALVFYNGGFLCVPRKYKPKEVDGKKVKTDLYRLLHPEEEEQGKQLHLDDEDPYYASHSTNGTTGPKSFRRGIGISDQTKEMAVIYDLKKLEDQSWKDENVEEWRGQLVRAFLVFEMFNPMQGYAPMDSLDLIRLTNTKNIDPNTEKFQRYTKKDETGGKFIHELKIDEFSIEVGGQSHRLVLGDRTANRNKLINEFVRISGQDYHGRNFGGIEGFFHTIRDDIGINPNPPASDTKTYYAFQTPCLDPVLDGAIVPFSGDIYSGGNFNFSGGQGTLIVRYRDTALAKSEIVIQQFKLDFPRANGWPVPKAVFRKDLGGFDPRISVNLSGSTYTDFNTDDTSTLTTSKWSRPVLKPGETKPNPTYSNLYDESGLPAGYGMAYHLPSRIAWARKTSDSPSVNKNSSGVATADGHHYENRWAQVLQPGDTIRSLVVGGIDPTSSDTPMSDPRIVALQQEVTTLKPHPDYTSQQKQRAQTLRVARGDFYFHPLDTEYAEGPGPNYSGSGFLFDGYTSPALPNNVRYIASVANRNYKLEGNPNPVLRRMYTQDFGPDLPTKDKNGDRFFAKQFSGKAPDFDTGIGNTGDGGFAGKADEGNVAQYWWDDNANVYKYVQPYFTFEYDPPLDTYFSPNRQAPSPVIFGSLPAPHVPWNQAAWKTLLFCPNPACGQDNHHGWNTSPRDHLLLDLFTMPTVEPYAISEPFSTAGKVNLNYQIVPFTYLKRTTALRAALHPLRVTAIPQSFLATSSGTAQQLRYKGQSNDENFRYLVDRDETIKGFDGFFDTYRTDRSRGFFKSASQVCERFLYPKGTTIDGSTVTYSTNDASARNFWDKNRLTGDNVREKPYADLYPRITTKSNTYTVHYRVQTLRQRPYSGNASGAEAYYRTWDESRDQVLSEYRGHTTIERYLDPEDPRFSASYTPASDRINPERESLEDAYRFRIIANKRFSPW